ncbi:MAG: hypothetical protein SGJ27_01760 [Candidatus Melainabacteria bacterium]|nr:hypothetical protein [Candidatus Melainabacteria bacterium]
MRDTIKLVSGMVLIMVARKLLQISFLASCLLLGALSAAGFASTGAACERSLRGPISLSPRYLKLDDEVTPGSMVLKSGSIFPVSLLTPLDSKTAHMGDKVQAMLLEDIVIGGKNIAPKGSHLTGWVNLIQGPRNVLESKFTPTNWSNANGAISIHFASIESAGTTKHPFHISIDAQPAPGTPLRGVQHEHELCVHRDGCISVRWSGFKYTATGVAISAASWATGPFKLITGPVLSGTAGAIKPEYALDKPVLKEDAMTRTKGGLVGAVKGLPGGFIITGVANRGGYIKVPSGVQLEVQLISDLVVPTKYAAKDAINI